MTEEPNSKFDALDHCAGLIAGRADDNYRLPTDGGARIKKLCHVMLCWGLRRHEVEQAVFGILDAGGLLKEEK